MSCLDHIKFFVKIYFLLFLNISEITNLKAVFFFFYYISLKINALEMITHSITIFQLVVCMDIFCVYADIIKVILQW